MSPHVSDTRGTRVELRVQLLGPPGALWAGDHLPISRRQVRALLYCLAAELAPLPRERLCFLFWPETPEVVARRKLSSLLSHLRRSLPDPEVVLTESDQVRLDPKRTASDTMTFAQLLKDPSNLEQAVQLYRGPFLAGFSLADSPEFEMWVVLERQAWERRYLDALAALIEMHRARQDYGLAIACAQQYLACDELAEDIHSCLIELYAKVGARRQALRQFEECTAVLERELGVRPLPQTQAAYQAVLESRPVSHGERAASPHWTTLPSLATGFLGRDEAMQRLSTAFEGARSGRGNVVLVSGEPGIGKSRLLQEFACSLAGQCLLLVGSGYRDAQSTPYQPIVEALRPALGAGHRWLRAPLRDLAEASQLLPELKTLYPGVPDASSDKSSPARSRLFESLCELIRSFASGPQPLLLCLDDLHWADSTTLDWLAFLGRQMGDSALLVVGAYRGEEADRVADLRHSLARQGNLTELPLDGLDEATVLRLIRRQGISDVARSGRDVASRLADITGGNPFFILEILRALLESGQAMEALLDLESLVLPDTVLEAVEMRLRRLSPTAHQVLEAAAVLGQTFDFDLVRRTSGRGELETLDGLDELVGRFLLVEETAGYRFCHELIQMAVYSGLGYWRRRVLHRRAGEALAGLQPTNASALARHFAQAEQLGRAAAYSLQAGRAAKAVFAHVEARHHFDQAISLLEEEEGGLREPGELAANQRLQVEALDERGWALRLLGHMDAYGNDLVKVSRLAASLQDPRTLAHLRWREAYTHRWFCRYHLAEQAAKSGLRLSKEQGDLFLEAQCLREIGMAARETGRYQRAHQALDRALVLFRELDEVLYQIHTLGNLATLQWYLAEYDRSRELAQEALHLCQQSGLRLELRLALGDLGAASTALGDYDLARQYLEESLSLARETADRTQEILCLHHLGWLHIRQNQPAEALHLLRAGLELARQVGSCTEQGRLHCGLAEAYRQLGRRGAAEAQATRALLTARRTARPYDEQLARRILARLAPSKPPGAAM